MNWRAFFAVIAVASGLGAWIALCYGIGSERRGDARARYYGCCVLLVLICAAASELSCS